MIRAVVAHDVMPMTIDDDEQRRPEPEELGLDADDVEDDRGEDDREDEGRQDEEEVGDPHQAVVGPAADEARDDADEGADEDRDQRRQEPDRHRDARAVDRQVEHVAAELVGPEDVGGRRWLERCARSRSSRSRAARRRAPARSARIPKMTRMISPKTPSRAAAEPAREVRAPLARRRQRSARRPDARPVGADGVVGASRPDPRIEEAVHDVGDEVGHHDGDRQQQEDALEHRVVARRRARRPSASRGPAS